MAASYDTLSQEFTAHAAKYTGGRIHFLIDGSNVAKDGYKFALAETDPVAEALSAVLDIRKTLPNTEVTATFWSGKNPLGVNINLAGNPLTWHSKIPGGSGHLAPTLDNIANGIDSGAIKTPLHLIVTHQFYGADEPDTIKAAMKRLQQTPGVTLDMVLHTDINLHINNIVKSVTAEDPSKPVGHYKILTPQEMRDALTEAAYSPVSRSLEQEQARDRANAATVYSYKADTPAPPRAIFKKKPG